MNYTGSDNIFIGYQAGFYNNGNGNAFIGYKTGLNNISGSQNAFIGYQAGQNNSTGGNNSFIGFNAGFNNTTGADNAFIGTYAGLSNTTGNDNAFIGHATGTYNTTGTGNAFLGTYAGYANTTGIGNAYVGIRSGQNTTTGNGNTFLGGAAGFGNTTGEQNTYIGQNAGFTGNSTGSQNVFIGVNAGVDIPSTVVNNAVAIGTNAIVTQSNSVVLGGTGVNSVHVGIGNRSPSAKLHITTGIANTSGIRLENLTRSSPASVLNARKFLTVDPDGNVIMGSISDNAQEPMGASLWQLRGTFLQSTQGEAVIIGQRVNKAPSGYKLYVEEGILTEKVKVAIKTSSDWSDKVFEKGYKLKSLHEVEQYIQKTGHLPGIPSAQEVVKQGINLGQMDAKLLEKIEEITLYLLDVKKEVDSLREENKLLRQELKNYKR
ncbi:bZIP transcription factor [Spirosoma aureum]|uniref:BZIP transcription factor n=1 Tax=Spirosoma aureum TaxID=2692134 RepID=A0A6G9B086_9BACT|nr:bZIP transcription factor [Spirosoma aureum]